MGAAQRLRKTTEEVFESPEPVAERREPVLAPRSRRAFSPLDKLLCELRPDLKDLFRAHDVAPHVAERLLDETLRSLSWKWDEVRNRQAWLMTILKRKCVCLADKSEQQPWDGLG